ncbi:MAG: hypothetical protein IJ409_09340 [Lachnospiraceae bacterium]|nr:hypothetical protein [Lachnospiraceae bacterium]
MIIFNGFSNCYIFLRKINTHNRTYKEVSLPFIHDCYSEEYEEYIEAGLLDIEAYGVIDGVQKYFYASFILKSRDMYSNGDYEQMIDFTILPESLAKANGDDRFLERELSGWGMNDVSCKERGKV